MRSFSYATAVCALCAIVALSSCMAQTFQVLRSGANSGLQSAAPQVQVVQDAASFERLFTRVMAATVPAPTPPAVDFTKDMVVYASLGEKPTAGYGVTIESIACVQATLKVKLAASAPKPGAMVAQVITNPYAIVATPRCPDLKSVEVSGPAAAFSEQPL